MIAVDKASTALAPHWFRVSLHLPVRGMISSRPLHETQYRLKADAKASFTAFALAFEGMMMGCWSSLGQMTGFSCPLSHGIAEGKCLHTAGEMRAGLIIRREDGRIKVQKHSRRPAVDAKTKKTNGRRPNLSAPFNIIVLEAKACGQAYQPLIELKIAQLHNCGQVISNRYSEGDITYDSSMIEYIETLEMVKSAS